VGCRGVPLAQCGVLPSCGYITVTFANLLGERHGSEHEANIHSRKRRETALELLTLLVFMNESEHPGTARAARVTTSDLSSVVRRHQRREVFKRHAATCPACQDPSNELCEAGHRLLKEAMRIASGVHNK
jgi:hypothetical protein